MNSRAILLSGVFCLSCLLLLGSMAIQLAVGDDRRPEPAQPAAADEPPIEQPDAAAEEVEPRSAPSQRPKALIKLETLVRHAEALMNADPAFHVSPDGRPAPPLSDEAITLFAEMVNVIDESSGLEFVIEVGDPDAYVAAERAEVFRGSLLLSLRNPTRLRIEEATTASPQLKVRATEIPDSL